MKTNLKEQKVINNTKLHLDLYIEQINNIQKSIEIILENIALKHGTKSIEYQECLELIHPFIHSNRIRQTYIVPYMAFSNTTYSHVSKQVEYMKFKKYLNEIDLKISPWDNCKKTDQEFVRSLGFSTPHIIQSKCKFEDLKFEDLTVIKPSHGCSSRNVFYFYNNSKIIEVRGQRKFNSIEEFKQEINNRQLEDSWQTESLILNSDNIPAHDIKVYSYYGEIGCILEIKRDQKARQCWYDVEGNVLISERRKQPWFHGSGFDPYILEYAKKISLAIPAPFMRIDFYKGQDEYYVGELTPHPGRYFPEYSPELDKYLGKLFCEAEARLFKDLIKKKSFKKYFKYYSN